MSDTTTPTAFTPRQAVVRIYGGDYLDRIRDLELRADAAREAAEGNGPRTNDEVPLYLQLAREHDELVKEAEAQAVDVVLQALGRTDWKALSAKHPPRSKDDTTSEKANRDAALGVNTETFAEELVPASVVSPEWAKEPAALDTLSDIDFERLWLTALGLNRAAVADPKASLVSRLSQTNDET